MKHTLRRVYLRLRLAAALLAAALVAGLLPVLHVFLVEGRAYLAGEARGQPGATAVSWLEARCYDLPFRFRRRPAPEDILIVEITTNRFERLSEDGDSRVDRRHFAAALDRLAGLEPRLLVLDVLLTSATGDTNDQRIAARLRQFGPRAVLVTSVGGPNAQPAPLFATSGVTLASADVDRHPDRTVRLLPERFAHDAAGRSVAMAAVEALGQPAPSVDPRPKARWLNYFGPRLPGGAAGGHTFARLDFADLVFLPEAEWAARRATNASKLVFLGDGRADTFRNPVDGRDLPGVEIHATAAANLRDRAWLRPVPVEFQLLFIAAWAGALALWLDRHRTPGARWIVAGATLAFIATSIVLPLVTGFWWWWLILPAQAAAALLATWLLPERTRFFISYRDADGRDHAQWLEGGIRAAGWRAFLSPGQTPPGTNMWPFFARQIRRAPAFLLVLTPRVRLDLTSPCDPVNPAAWPWVRREVAWALRSGRRLLVLRAGTEPIRLGDVPDDLAALPGHLDFEFNINTRDEAVRAALRVLHGEVA